MSRNWTENQKLAIEARSGSVLVSAAAGSGKTAVLVERVIQIVTDSSNPVPIDRLLIVTYTRAAAAELRERINRALNSLISSDPHNSWYRRQLVHLPCAHISTVDSFCGDLVKEFYQSSHDEAGDFRIAEEGELSVLRQEAMAHTLDLMYENAAESFYDLVDAFSSARDDRRLEKNILRLYDFIRSHPFEHSWLKDRERLYDNCSCGELNDWSFVLFKHAYLSALYAQGLVRDSLLLLEEEPELMSKVGELFLRDQEYINNVISALKESDWNKIRAAVNSFEAGRLAATGFTNHPIKLHVAENRKQFRKVIDKIKSMYFCDEEQFIAELEIQKPIVNQMFRCVKEFSSIYSDLKRKRKIADFSDIEHWALDLLVDGSSLKPQFTEVSKLVSKRFDHVMVDEYQDANEVQDLIFNAVSSGGKNLFVVGDAKQSIYGFRQAMPEIFISRKESLPYYDPEQDNYPSKVILEKNFRSRKEVTDYINFTFSQLMTKFTGEIEYNKEEYLVPQAPYPPADSPCTELHLIDLDFDDEDEDDVSLVEARHMASVIHRMCKETYITDNSEQRLVTFGDVAILMRNMNKYGDIYAQELKRCGVPAVCKASAGFLTALEIKLAVNFLRVIDNPIQDIPLASVLMSPVFGFTPDDMACIRSASRKSSLFMALRNFADSGDRKSSAFLSTLDTLRDLSLTMPADLFINTMYDMTGLLSVAMTTGGELAVSNLRLLSEYANRYENGSARGVSAFVDYLDRLERDGTDLPAAVSGNDDNLNAVRIMTIHGSKGLEFPVCILANTGRQFSTDANENALIDSKLGFACKLYDKDTRCRYNTITRTAVSLEIKKREKAEELRVLYVAMTRAKERLIMLASRKNMQNYVTSLAAKLTSYCVDGYVVSNSRYLSDWLVICALLHPNGDELRSFGHMDDVYYFSCEDTSNFKVVFSSNKEEPAFIEADGAVSSRILHEDAPDNFADVISKRFDYQYPYEAYCTLPQKVTASEIAHKSSDNPHSHSLRRIAAFYESGLTPAQRGTAMHLFLENCDYLRAREDISSEIRRLVNHEILDQLQADSLDIEQLEKFIHSDIITLALNSRAYHREYRFTVDIPAGMTDDTLTGEVSEHSVILQGSIDLAIETESGIIIVDYKTDRVNNTDDLLSMYSKQLELYREAIQQTTGKKVIRCLIYSVYLSQITEVM